MPDETGFRIPDLQKMEFHQEEITVKKSRFIASVGHVQSVDEAREFITFISNQYADARHNCYAFNAGPPGDSAYVGMSDDGEPHGTAGSPMLNVILHSEIGEICVVVTRYFGGILLGTGGLTKAYQDSVKAALETLKTTIKQKFSTFQMIIDHKYSNLLMQLKSRYKFKVPDTIYSDRITVRIVIDEQKKDTFLEEMMNSTKGTILVIEDE